MEFYDVRVIESESLILRLENGKMENSGYNYSKEKGFRVLKDGFWGVFEGDVDLNEGIRRAEKNVLFSSDSAVLRISSSGKYQMKVKEKASDVPVEEKVEMLRDVEDIVSDVAVSTKVTYLENVRRFSYTDSHGNEVFYEVPRIGVSVFAVGKGETLQFYSRRLMKVGGFEKLKNVFDIAEKVKDVLSELVNAPSPPSGEMNVLMDQSLAGVFVHEAFGHAAEADHVLQGSTVLIGKLNQKVADNSVTICDNPLIEEFGFYPFDDEGVPASETVIVKNGILKSYLHTRETAAKLGGKPGNARADGVDFPIVRMSNTYMKPPKSAYSFEELVEECGNGVYLVGSRGGETDPATGYFHFNAQYGYVVRNREIAEIVRDVSLSGNTLSILQNVKLGREFSFDPGFCGKASQLVPVSDGSPTLLSKAIVGGE